MGHNVIGLRDVALPTCGRDDGEWMTLEAARAAGVDLSYVADGIGPRVRGMVYRGGYYNNVSTVHGVFVDVVTDGRNGATGPRAAWWQVAEESAGDCGRVRRHSTSWEYDARNEPLFMINA